MKLKKLKKLINRRHKRCGNVDVEFLTNEGKNIEIESIGYFNFVKDVTITFTTPMHSD